MSDGEPPQRRAHRFQQTRKKALARCEGRRLMARPVMLFIKAAIIVAALLATGWWSVQNDDDTPRGDPARLKQR